MPYSIVYDENDEFVWDSIATETREDGSLDLKIITYDNGIVNQTSYYTTGQKYWSYRTDTEDKKLWSAIETLYDEDGSLRGKTVIKDDGGFTQWEYTDGTLLRKAEFDSEAGGGSKNWSARITDYDESGKKAEVTTVYDDHRLRIDTFSADGTKTTKVRDNSVDGADFNWQSKDIYRDADGNITNNLFVFDNDDVQASIYDDGHITNRLSIDGDDSHSWYAREFVFDSNGNRVDTIYYEDYDDIPEYWIITPADTFLDNVV